MLDIALDDPATRRLILRAKPWTRAELARRAVATACALAVLTFGVVLATQVDELSASGWIVAGALALATWVISRPGPRVAELVVDGDARTVRVTTRGHLSWWTKGTALALADTERLLRVRGGLVAPEGIARPELGIELWHGRHGERLSLRLAPRLAIAGVDRRSELRALVETLARRMQLGVVVERDELDELAIVVSHRGEIPPASAQERGGYRAAPTGAPLDLARRAGFEAPPGRARELPAATESRALRARVRLRDGSLSLEPLPREWRIPGAARRLLLAVVAGAVFGAAVGAYLGVPWRGLGIGAAAPLGLAAVYAALELSGLLSGVTVVILIEQASRPLRLGSQSEPRRITALRARHWSLGDGSLRAEGILRTRDIGRGARGVVVLWEPRRPLTGTPRVVRELWLWSAGWILLAKSEEPLGTADGAVLLDALAVHVARELDLPIRSANAITAAG